MKYIITERQYELLNESTNLEAIKKMVFSYLNGFDWDIKDTLYDTTTRLFIKGEDQYPEQAQFESYTDFGDEDDEEIRILLIKRELVATIRSLFNAPWSEIYGMIQDWYNQKTGEKTTDMDTM